MLEVTILSLSRLRLWVSFPLSSNQGVSRAGLHSSLHKLGIFKVRDETCAGGVLALLRGNGSERVTTLSTDWFLLLATVTTPLAALVFSS